MQPPQVQAMRFETPSALPPAPSMCYKPYMRKWMSDRLKRRKKTKESKPAEPPQAPLQPAYFDAEAAPAGPVSSPTPEPEADSGLVEVPEPEQAATASRPSSGDAPQGGQQRPRRRRTRGGRGRGGQRSGARSAAPPVVPSPEATVAAATPSAIPSAPPRPPKGAVVLAIGLPGSGKSSWFKRNNITPLSSDMVRLLLFDDSQEQRFQDLVFSNLRSMLKARLIARRPLNYVDATNLTPHERASWIKLAKDYDYEVQAVYFDVPLEICLERNRRRDRTVDEDVMRRMAAKLKAPTFEEGFSKVTVVRVKKKDTETAT
jgi:predicted kinase